MNCYDITLFPDEGRFTSKLRGFLQKLVPLSGDILLGVTKIRRMHIAEVNVPKGTHITISNNRHACRPSPENEIRHRKDVLLGSDLHYKLFTVNCEHFATFVRYGVSICNQVMHKLHQHFRALQLTGY